MAAAPCCDDMGGAGRARRHFLASPMKVWHLCRLYNRSAHLVWNSYAARFIYIIVVGLQVAGRRGNFLIFGAVMKHHSGAANPYSPLACFLLLLMAGIFLAYKIGALDQLFHLAHN